MTVIVTGKPGSDLYKKEIQELENKLSGI